LWALAEQGPFEAWVRRCEARPQAGYGVVVPVSAAQIARARLGAEQRNFGKPRQNIAPGS